MSAIPNPTPCPRYQFAGVVLDSERRSVWVDGRPVGCSGKAFALLLCLAERPRQPLPRDLLIDQVWPGGQVVSDEALTQLVFRARAVLGSHGGLIKTVRGVGFELEADVELLEAEPTLNSPAQPTLIKPSQPAAANPGTAAVALPDAARPSSRDTRQHWFRVMAFGSLLALCVGWLWLLTEPAEPPAVADPVLNEGYGLIAADVQGSTEAQRELIAQAFMREEHGERQRAEGLMEAAHYDNSKSALPATMLALWSFGSGRKEDSEHWLAAAQTRLNGSAIYEHLLLNYVSAEVKVDPDLIIATAGALLDLRPNAWRMRHARSHMYEYRGQREAALNELRGIKFAELGVRKRDWIIADIASFGDLPFAEAQLQRLANDPNRTTWCFLQGRLAWTRTDWAGAADWFGQSADLAERGGQQDQRSRAASYQAASLVMLGDDQQALARLERARTLIGDRQPRDELDLTVMIATLRAALGELAQSAEEVERAQRLLTKVLDDDTAEAARLALLRLSPRRPPPPPKLPESSSQMALWEATSAYLQGDRDRAGARLALAIQRGIAKSRLQDDSRWLQVRLGLPVAAAGLIDPPYPPLSRLLLHRELDSH